MDILRKELDSIYASQRLGEEILPSFEVDVCRRLAAGIVDVSAGCSVVTDASCDQCCLYTGELGVLLGIADRSQCIEIDSSDEDMVYNRIHPEDLVDKRMLEYEFFKRTDALPVERKTSLKATCTIRMKDRTGNYRYVDNTTQIIRLSPAGKMWLILCCYCLSPVRSGQCGISPCLIDNSTGDIIALSFDLKRNHILTEREKEILRLIQKGKPSKQIACMLGISMHTVNRHRQNIIEKLSVGNCIEAITAATAMKLL